MSILFLNGLFDGIKTWFEGFTGAILSFIPKTIYLICTFIFAVMDILQIFFRKAVGLDMVYMSQTVVEYSSDGRVIGEFVTTDIITGDIVTKFIGDTLNGNIPILYNVMMGMLVLGAIMIILSTFVAIIRSEWVAEDSKSASKGRIFARSIKALFSFIMVPVTCYFGLIVGNAILRALDEITAQSGPVDAAVTTYFKESDVRGTGKSIIYDEATGKPFKDYKYSGEFVDYDAPVENIVEELLYGGPFKRFDYVYSNDSDDLDTGKTSYRHYMIYNNVMATTAVPLSGQIFRSAAYGANRLREGGLVKNAMISSNPGPYGRLGFENGNFLLDDSISDSRKVDIVDQAFVNGYILKESTTLKTTSDWKLRHLWKMTPWDNWTDTVQNMDKFKVGLVWYFYDLWKFDFIIAIGSLVCIAMLLINVVFGMIKRMYELMILFLIAPPIAGIMPLDNGEALKKWRTKFVGKAIGAYASVVCLNLFFILLGVLTQISWFNIPIIDYFCNVIVVIVGLVSVKEMTATVSEIIGAEDAMKAGADVQKEVGGALAAAGKIGGAAIGVVGGAAKLGVGAAKGLDRLTGGHGAKAIGNIRANRADAKQLKILNREERGAGLKKGERTSKEQWNNMSKEQKQQFTEGARRARENKEYDKKHGAGSSAKLWKSANDRAKEKYEDEHGKGSWKKLTANKQRQLTGDERFGILKSAGVGNVGQPLNSAMSKIGSHIANAGKPVEDALKGLATRIGALGTHMFAGSIGRSDMFKAFKENGGTQMMKTLGGASDKDLDVAKMTKDMFKQESARAKAGDKIKAKDFKLPEKIITEVRINNERANFFKGEAEVKKPPLDPPT